MIYTNLSRITIYVVIASGLFGCSNSQQSNQNLMSDQQVKQFANEWQKEQQNIQRLAAMEQDLALLIAALAEQTHLAEQPVQLASDTEHVIHQNDELASQSHQTFTPKATNANEDNALPGVQLGLYLSPSKVSQRVLQLRQAYPNAFEQLDFRFKLRPNKGVNLYGLRVGPFENYTQATAFCQLAMQMGQKCITAPFAGQAI